MRDPDLSLDDGIDEVELVVELICGGNNEEEKEKSVTGVEVPEAGNDRVAPPSIPPVPARCLNDELAESLGERWKVEGKVSALGRRGDRLLLLM